MTRRSTDEDLYKAFIKGKYQAFETLYLRYRDPLFRFITRYGHHQNADDIYHAVWESVIKNAAAFRFDSSFSTYLYRLAHNKLIDHHRHLAVVDTVIDASHSVEKAVSPSIAIQSAEVRQQQQTLSTCIAKLPHMQREAFLLKQEGGFKQEQIAHIVDANLEAVKSRLRAAYKNLKTCVDKALSKEVA